MNLKSILAIIIITFLSGLSGTTSANLLANGDFEGGCSDPFYGGMPDGWADDWNGPNLTIHATNSPWTPNPQHGSNHVRNFWDGGLYQNVSVTPGAQYRMTGWTYIPYVSYNTPVDPWGTYIGFRWLDADGNLIANAWQANLEGGPRDIYVQSDSGFLTAPQGAATAMVRFGTWCDYPYAPVTPTDFDNFDFSPVPEPASLLLLGTGLVGLFGARKRIAK